MRVYCHTHTITSSLTNLRQLLTQEEEKLQAIRKRKKMCFERVIVFRAFPPGRFPLGYLLLLNKNPPLRRDVRPVRGYGFRTENVREACLVGVDSAANILVIGVLILRNGGEYASIS